MHFSKKISTLVYVLCELTTGLKLGLSYFILHVYITYYMLHSADVHEFLAAICGVFDVFILSLHAGDFRNADFVV